jgi:glycosyltransferase involved in cell wall biosynthesis
MEALNPARLPVDRHPERLSLQDLEPVRPLRICLLGYRSHPYGGGQGVYLRYLSKALLELGHQVDVISGPPYPHLVPGVRLIEMPSMNLYETGLLSLRPRHLRSLSNVIEWLSKLTGGFAEPQAFGRRALKYLRAHRADYDIVHDNQSLSYGVLALQREGVPLVTTIHHPITGDLRLALAACRWWWPKLLTLRWHSFLRMQKRVARELRHVVTVSACSLRDIANDFAVPAERISLVPNGVDTEVFAPDEAVARKPLQIMATASADQPLKGLAVLLRAFAGLLPAHPGLRLLVVGRPRAGGDTEKLIAALGVGPHIDFVSGISTAELVRHYRESTLVVVPSLYEGFGLPASEAMACGSAVISSDGGALPEVVGDAGVLVPAGNVAALAEAIAVLLADPARRGELGQRARARMLDRFCWRRSARQMTRYYEQVLAADGNRQS